MFLSILLVYVLMARFTFRFCVSFSDGEAEEKEFKSVNYFCTVFWPVFLTLLGLGILLIDLNNLLTKSNVTRRWWRGY